MDVSLGAMLIARPFDRKVVVGFPFRTYDLGSLRFSLTVSAIDQSNGAGLKSK